MFKFLNKTFPEVTSLVNWATLLNRKIIPVTKKTKKINWYLNWLFLARGIPKKFSWFLLNIFCATRWFVNSSAFFRPFSTTNLINNIRSYDFFYLRMTVCDEHFRSLVFWTKTSILTIRPLQVLFDCCHRTLGH